MREIQQLKESEKLLYQTGNVIDFLLKWILVSTFFWIIVGGFVAISITYYIGFAVFGAAGPQLTIHLVIFLILIVAGLFGLGASQQRLLRQYIPGLEGWLKATVLSASASLLYAGFFVFSYNVVAAGPLLIMCFMGIVQWRVLRQYIPQAHWWFWASLAAGAVGGMIGSSIKHPVIMIPAAFFVIEPIRGAALIRLMALHEAMSNQQWGIVIKLMVLCFIFFSIMCLIIVMFLFGLM